MHALPEDIRLINVIVVGKSFLRSIFNYASKFFILIAFLIGKTENREILSYSFNVKMKNIFI